MLLVALIFIIFRNQAADMMCKGMTTYFASSLRISSSMIFEISEQDCIHKDRAWYDLKWNLLELTWKFSTCSISFMDKVPNVSMNGRRLRLRFVTNCTVALASSCSSLVGSNINLSPINAIASSFSTHLESDRVPQRLMRSGSYSLTWARLSAMKQPLMIELKTEPWQASNSTDSSSTAFGYSERIMVSSISLVRSLSHFFIWLLLRSSCYS